MWLDQAVFTSTKTRHGEGYHVIAKSPGISSDIIASLNRWCPSHASLQSTNHDSFSINYHSLVGSSVAVSRTTYGLKEFSQRGGLQVVTVLLVLRRKQLEGYDNNVFRLVRMARSLGHLRWKPHFSERLSAIELPSEELAESLLKVEDTPCAFEHAELLRSGQRLAVIGRERRNAILENIVRQLMPAERVSFYFTTGLKWSKQRPYHCHVLQSVDSRTRIRLNADNVRIVEASLIPG